MTCSLDLLLSMFLRNLNASLMSGNSAKTYKDDICSTITKVGVSSPFKRAHD